MDHEQSLPDLLVSFPGVTKEELLNGEAWAVEKIELTTHSGTHLDAPCHDASTIDKGARAITIDEVPLEWCFQPGIRHGTRAHPDTATGSLRSPSPREILLR
jgi:kynurenine formamidase